jgi:hypothetical protein
MFDVTTQFAAAATAAAVIQYKWNARRTDGKGVNTVPSPVHNVSLIAQ